MKCHSGMQLIRRILSKKIHNSYMPFSFHCQMKAPSFSNPMLVIQQQLNEQESIKPKYMHYLNLMRADKPIGVWLLYWPCTWSIALSTPAGYLPDPKLLSLFGVGAFLMRSAGCIFNDLWDREIDRKVERTKNRPLATGQVTEKEATILLATLLSSSLAILFQLNPLSILIGASSIWLVVSYPLAKRYTNWPQLVLGATFNWGAILGYTAATGQFIPEICIPLYAACICWTMVYDTIYAHQDKEDDLMIGVKSTALRFGDKTSKWLCGFSTAMLTNLAFVGVVTEQNWPFYASLIAISGHLAWQIGTLQTNSSEDCWRKFHSNQWIGAVIFCGIAFSNILADRKRAENSEEKEEKEEEDNLRMSKLEQRNSLNVNFYSPP